MADEEQVRLLRSGVEAWNEWREENPDAEINLGKADLSGAKLSGADLRRADLIGPNLLKAKPSGPAR